MSNSPGEENEVQASREELDHSSNTSADLTSDRGSHFDIKSDSVANAAIGDTVHQYNFMAGSEGLNVFKETSFNVAEYRVSEDELTEIRKTFVRTASFVQIAKCLVQNHILIIAGEEGVGKRAVAIYIAARARKAGKVAEVFELSDKLDVYSDSLIKQHQSCVFIIEDAFASDNSLALRLMGEDSGSFGRLRNLLKPHGQVTNGSSYLILTVHNKNLGRLRSQLSRILSDRKILIQDYRPPSPEDVLTKHLSYHLGEDRSKRLCAKCGDYLENVVQDLRQPDRIVRLVKNVLQDIDLGQTAEQIAGQIEESLTSVRSLDNEIERFFESLDEEEKLLALNLSLLGSYGRKDCLESYLEHDFWHMHALISPKKDEKDDKHDKDKDDDEKQDDDEIKIQWSSIPKSKCLERIRAKVARYRVLVGEDEQLFQHVKFKDKQYAQTILTYVKKNHPDFLLRVLSHLTNLAKQHETLIDHNVLDNKRHAQAILEYIKGTPDFRKEIISDLLNLVRHDNNYAKAIKRYVKEAHSIYFSKATNHLDNPTEEGIDALLKHPELQDRQYAKAILDFAIINPDFQEAIISDINNRINRFEWYSKGILEHVRSRYPGFLQEVTYDRPGLDEEIESHPDSVIACVTYILGLIGYTNWLTVEQLVHQWARNDQPRIRAMASYVLGAAHRDSEMKKYVDYILQKYINSKDEKLLWTAAKAYEVIGLVDLETALNGLEGMVYCLDISSREFVEPIMSYLNAFAEEKWHTFFLDQANVSLLDNKRIATIQYEEYLEKYFKAFEDYDRVIQVYDAIGRALWVLARYVNLKEVLNILSDWATDLDKRGEHTARLTASLMGLSLAKALTEIAEEEKSQNRILELISRDEDALDALAELMSSSLIRLYPIQLAKQRKSMDVCLLLEKWATSAEYNDTLTSLLRRIQTYLKDDPLTLKYFNRLFVRMWQSKKMTETVRSLAGQMLQN
jgi:RecA/RadA recombinase